jgi:transcriptional regulator with XRE-family HTH domain
MVSGAGFSRLLPVTTVLQRSAFGNLLRHLRTQRGLSQLALALRVATTTRHLSYLENGRSRPGRELVLRLADCFELPLRARNELLVAAGLAAEFPARPLGGDVLAPYRRAITGVITALEPFPAFVVDPLLNLQETNAAGSRLVPRSPGDAPINLLDAFLAPGPTRDQVDNFAEVAWSLFTRFSRAAASLPVATPGLEALRRRVQHYLDGVPRPPPDATGEPVICPTLRLGDRRIRTIGMTMRFGPSRDVTLEELSVDVLYPRDADAEQFFRGLALPG